jgi:hypothetical protein
LQQALQKI